MNRQGSPGATGPTIFEIVVRGALRGLAPQLGSDERFLNLDDAIAAYHEQTLPDHPPA